MPFQNIQKGTWIRILLSACGWSLAALFAATYIVLQNYSRQKFDPLWQVLLWQFATAAGWLILTPLIFWLVKTFPLGGKKLSRNAFIHIVGGLAIVLARQAIDAFVQPLIGFPPGNKFTTYFESMRFIFISDFHFSVITYCVALGLIFGTSYYKQFREREIQALQLSARLAQARMHVLKMQLHPHFLFNTHNAISELIYKDPEAAEEMLGNLSDLLRISLEKLEVEKVPLQQELDFLNKYLMIEQTRFRDRLRVTFEIAPETYDSIVPNMILQPLVENAIKHGIAPLARGGEITVRALKNKENLQIEICDDGIGVPFGNPEEIVEGIGLSNTRARLKYFYANDHKFEVQPNGEKGLKVTLVIPYSNSIESIARKENINLEKLYENPDFNY